MCFQRKRDRKRARLIAKRQERLENLREMFPDEVFAAYYDDGQGGGSLFGGIFDDFIGGLFGSEDVDDDSMFGDLMEFDDYDDYYDADDDLIDALDDYYYYDDDYDLLLDAESSDYFTDDDADADQVDLFGHVRASNRGAHQQRGAGIPNQESLFDVDEKNDEEEAEEGSYHAWLRRMKKVRNVVRLRFFSAACRMSVCKRVTTCVGTVCMQAFRAERANGAQTTAPLNVLVLVADDFGFDAYHALENLLPDEKLPSSGIRKLAREGLQFREASTHISSPLPSRAALLTGCSAQSSGYIDARTLVPSRHSTRTSSKRNDFAETPEDTAQECYTLLQTLKELKYDTSFVGAVGGDLFGDGADSAPDAASSSPRKKFRASIASENRKYFDWLLDMEPHITEDGFFSKETKIANNQKTGVVQHGNRITVPYAQVLEMPVDVLDAISQSSCLPNVMDFAEERAAGKVDNNHEDLPPWALFGTTSLPPSLSRAAFVANQTINILRRVMRRQSKAAENSASSTDGEILSTKPFGLVASFANPFTPWLVSGQTYNALIGPLEGGIAGVPLPAHMVPGKSDDSAAAILDEDDPLFSARSPAERSLSKRVQNFVVKNPTRARYLAALYYAKVKDVSDAVGAIIKALDRFNLSENTLVRIYLTV